MFVEFRTQGDANKALETFKEKCDKDDQRRALQGPKMWSNYDMPIKQRAPRGFLLGLRWLLLQWNFPKDYINVDLSENVLKAGG